jgi:hypothetical protein
VLREEIMLDTDWTEVVDQLNVDLHFPCGAVVMPGVRNMLQGAMQVIHGERR